MNRRSFLRNAAGVLAGALGAGWLWKRKPEDITDTRTLPRPVGLNQAANEQLLFDPDCEEITFKGMPMPYEPRLDEPQSRRWRALGHRLIFAKTDAVCVLLQQHFSKRVWPPYAVRIFDWHDHYGVAIGHGSWETGPQYCFTFEPEEVEPGATDLLERRFDEGFKRLREIVAKGSLETGVQA